MKKPLFFLAIFISQTLVAQNVGIGITTPNAKLSISVNGTELVGTAAGNTLRTNAGSLGSTAGSEISLANIGFLSSNNSSLGVRAYRSSAGTDWTSTALLLGYDVDNTLRAGGGFLALGANGNIGISTTAPLFPLSFNGNLGDKISLWSNSTNSYGFGIQSSLLQIHTDIAAADIVFGYGSSAALTETMRIKGNGNTGIGITNPLFKLDVRNGSINTDSVYRIGTVTVLATPAINNLFVGKLAGINTTGGDNSFFGFRTGNANISGNNNCFFGASSGLTNTTGLNNCFFGASSGLFNTTGNDNSFFGMSAGAFNNTGYSNSFFGRAAGLFNSTGYSNSFFGDSSGYSNVSGVNNSFFGHTSGFSNTTGLYNSFFGDGAGLSNTNSFNNSFFGFASGLFNTADSNSDRKSVV